MFYDFHGMPYSQGSGNIGPCRKRLKNEFRNGTLAEVAESKEPERYMRMFKALWTELKRQSCG
jgi:hypothetical protein